VRENRVPVRLSGLTSFSPEQVLALVSDASGFIPENGATGGAFRVEAQRILDACGAAGDRLAEACRRGERMILATGHPVGLILLYSQLATELQRRGVEILHPLEGEPWTEDGELRTIEYLGGVAMYTDGERPMHTHSGAPMARLLLEDRPDLVLADHGFAGTAIEWGIETISVADVNDPALLVAKEAGEDGDRDRDGRQRPPGGVLALFPGDRGAPPLADLQPGFPRAPDHPSEVECPPKTERSRSSNEARLTTVQRESTRLRGSTVRHRLNERGTLPG
jgi:hypothetical protein